MSDKKIITIGGGKGMGFTDWLQLMFIAFKLLGIIEWSWWLVISPILATAGVVVIGALLVALVDPALDAWFFIHDFMSWLWKYKRLELLVLVGMAIGIVVLLSYML